MKEKYAGFRLGQVCQCIDVAGQQFGGWVSHYLDSIQLLLLECRQKGGPPALTRLRKSGLIVCQAYQDVQMCMDIYIRYSKVPTTGILL